MPENVELVVVSKGDLREGRVPPHWEDPENITEVEPHHRRFLVENPLSHSDDDPVRAYALVGTQVAGRLGLTMGEMNVEGEPLPILWGFNLFVSTRFRGRGLAIELIRCWRDAHHTAVGMHVNIPSLGIYHKLGWTQIDTPNLYSVLRSRKFVEGFVPWRPVAALASPLVDAGVAVRRALGRFGGARPHPGLVAERAATMPPGLDTVLGRLRAAATTHRSAAWINWMLHVSDANENGEARLFLVRDPGGEVVGYFIVHRARRPLMRGRFRDLDVGSMMDWDVFDDSRADLPSLLLMAEAECRRWGTATFMVTIADHAVARTLKRLGFGHAQPLRTLYHAVPPSPLADERFKDPSRWHLARADDDGLFI